MAHHHHVRIECPRCAHGFFGDFGDWVKGAYNKVKNEIVNPDSTFRKTVVPLAKQAARTFGGPVGNAVATAADAVGLGRPKRTRRGGWSVKMQQRNALVRRLMHERGLSLPQASAAVKREGLM